MSDRKNREKTTASKCSPDLEWMVRHESFLVRYCCLCVALRRLSGDLVLTGHCSFLPKDHYCMVFETLGKSLFDVIKANDYKRLPMPMVRDICRQLIEAMHFLKSVNLIHTGTPSGRLLALPTPLHLFTCLSWICRLETRERTLCPHNDAVL